MRKLLTIISLSCLVACTPISDDDRLIEVAVPLAPVDGGQDNDQPVVPIVEPVAKNVLIEDFTGQRCSNCPEATELIETLASLYGANRIIGVGVHCNPLGFAGNAKNVGLMGDQGVEYGNAWHVNSQPIGMVNRSGGLKDRLDWTALVSSEVTKTTPVSLGLTNTFDAATSTLSIDVNMAVAEAVTANLQLWLVEDDIVAMQVMPTGATNREYKHKHVFREAINGLWGDAVSVARGEMLNKTYTYTFDPSAQPATTSTYVPHNCSVVAFVYSDAAGVMQVVRKAVTAD